VKIADESARWAELGIITAEQRGEILSLYKNKNKRNPLMIIFAITGSLLLGLGIVLIFASNWRNMARSAKIAIAFLPAFAAMGILLFTLLKRRNSAAWLESASLGVCLSVFATTALISQVFQSPYGVVALISVCMFFCLPPPYLYGVKSPAVVYVICMVWVGLSGQMPFWFSLLNAALIAPYIILQFRKADDKFVVWLLTAMSSVTVAFLFLRMPPYEWEYFLYKITPLAVAVIALEAFIKRRNADAPAPLTALACVTVVITLFVSTFGDAEMHEYMGDILAFAVSALSVLIFAAAYMVYRKRKSVTDTDLIVLCAVLGLPMFWLWSNALLLALGIALIAFGGKAYSLKRVNCGMLTVIAVIVARFFDSGLELFGRGIAFVLIGACFIATNFVLHKKWRSK